jgi:transposase InsO family protein
MRAQPPSSPSCSKSLRDLPAFEAEVLIERWRRHDNTIRPHSALGYRPPAPEAILPWPSGPA